MTGKATNADAPSTQTGPRQKVHICVRYEGKGRPGPRLTERCNTLVDMLVEADAGTIQDRKAGDGTVNIYVVTRYPEHTTGKAWKIVNELGIAARTTIQIDSGKAGR